MVLRLTLAIVLGVILHFAMQKSPTWERHLITFAILAAFIASIIFYLCVPVNAAPTVRMNNYNQNNYSEFSTPIRSMIYQDWKTRQLVCVHADIDKISVAEVGMDTGTVTKSFSMALELPLFGAMLHTEDANYILYGDTNVEENDQKEVVRLVRYTTDWRRIDSISFFGCDITRPFRAGTPVIVDHGDTIYVYGCKEKYKTPDGKCHQTNFYFEVSKSGMARKYSTLDGDPNVSYTSHSFRQDLIIDGSTAAAIDHGDGYPWRGAIYTTWDVNTHKMIDQIEFLDFPGEVGNVQTGATLGNITKYKGLTYVSYTAWDGTRNVPYVWCVETNEHKMLSDTVDASVVRLNAVSHYGLYANFSDKNTQAAENVWNLDAVYAKYFEPTDLLDNEGVTEYHDKTYFVNVETGDTDCCDGAPLSDAPLLAYGKCLIWYAAEYGSPVVYFYDVVTHNLNKYDTNVEARADVKNVEVNGHQVAAVALYDDRGYPTNYVNIRNFNEVANTVKPGMNVEWDGAVKIYTDQPTYWVGYEFPTKYFGRKTTYSLETDLLYVNDVPHSVECVKIYDSNGGGYTFFKIRDLCTALEIPITWDGAIKIGDA